MAVLGFIGTGNMGGALAEAAAKRLSSGSILLSNRTQEKAWALQEKLLDMLPETSDIRDDEDAPDICVCTNDEAAARADYLFLGVKPNMLADLFEELRPVLSARREAAQRTGRDGRPVLVSMAAGTSIARIRELSGGDYPIIRIMPNTPASVGEGMILYAASPEVSSEQLGVFLDSLDAAGIFTELPEKLIDAGSAVSGCGPAFADLFIEALADGGVLCGLPRDKALVLAAQMTAGAAKLVLESGRHPGALKDAVCSPGGTTIEGVRALEKGAFRSAVMEAVIASYEKTKKV